MKDIRRLQAEIELLQINYSPENVDWAGNYDWLRVMNYRLPPGYNRAMTPVLAWVPEHYGYGQPYMDFFVASGLRFWHQGNWSELPHYFERYPYSRLDDSLVQEIKEQGWSYLCIHPDGWKTSDNILTFLSQVYVFLCDPFRNWDEDSYAGHNYYEYLDIYDDDDEYDYDDEDD